ncbi:MAG: ammonium transporter [Nitrospirae bacterium]|nr:ammonium transporter [Nitrospirota bacterium]MBF0591345.1 ammonium transporter [Nitrospirota bacterium]
MKRIILTTLFVLTLCMAAWAADVPKEVLKVDTGDTAWMLISTALVMLMTPGLGFFYGGMVRRKNVLGTIMHSFVMLCMVSVIWVLWGYSLSFGPDIGGVIGSLSWFGLNSVGQEPSDYAKTIPHLLFMIYQGMFAVITPALITGAFAERMKFSALLVFSALWLTLVYAPVCHWVWGGGWIGVTLGAIDFAGGTVVHINSAMAAVAAVIIMGKRKGYGRDPMPPHNLPMTILGGALLWFGWFGFNSGSALSSSGLAAVAFVTTNTATAMAAMTWMVVEWIHRGKPTALGAVSGAVAGLVAITPAAGFVSPMASIIIGMGAGVLCYIAVSLKPKFGYDDSLDVIGVHGVGGTWGALATGLFASKLINPTGGPDSLGVNGLFYGDPGQFLKQLTAVAATYVYVLIVSLVLFKVVDLVIGLRASEEDEFAGLDLSMHGEKAYDSEG